MYLQLNENDNLPKSICGECKKIIINWHEFWEQSLRIDRDLKLRLINSAEVILVFLYPFHKHVLKNKHSSKSTILNL